jgi:hypothetical protein
MFRNAFFICMLLIPASMASHYAMAADSCQPVFDAITNIITNPSHSYSTGVVNGKPRSTETIYVQGKTYMIVKGNWWLSPVTPNDVLQQEMENRTNSKATCQFLRNESVNGEPAAVYFMRRETESAKEDGQMWISKRLAARYGKKLMWTPVGRWGRATFRHATSTAM